MTKTQFLLCKIAEEAAEVSQIAMKCQQFGLLEKHPDLSENNAQRLYAELIDLQAVVEMLEDEADILQFDAVDRQPVTNKKAKVCHYLEYSKELGEVIDE